MRGIANCCSGALSCLILALTVLSPGNVFAANEDNFDVLQTATHTYQKVKVTTKAKGYIFIVHSAGMANVKVSELPMDVLEKLGYISHPKVQTNSAALWARQTVGRMNSPQIKGMETKLIQAYRRAAFVAKAHLPPLSRRLIAIGSVTLLVAFLFHSYCCLLICRKIGKEPGVLVWLPLLQVVPMLRAASMSAWWTIALFVPVLNLVAYAVWCFKIVEARHKTMPLGVLLLLPVTSWFAFVYLAFSETASSGAEKFHLEVMTLESA
jgi:hypothetical protein